MSKQRWEHDTPHTIHTHWIMVEAREAGKTPISAEFCGKPGFRQRAAAGAKRTREEREKLAKLIDRVAGR